jgi:hypothetical protein
MSKIVYTLPVASTALVKEPKFGVLLGRFCSLTYSNEADNNPELVIVEKLLFEGVEAFQCTYYRAVWIDMIDTYDRLTDMGKSKWLDAIIRNLNESGGTPPGLKHLRLYFDSGPCYEFVCRNFTIEKYQESVLSNPTD